MMRYASAFNGQCLLYEAVKCVIKPEMCVIKQVEIFDHYLRKQVGKRQHITIEQTRLKELVKKEEASTRTLLHRRPQL